MKTNPAIRAAARTRCARATLAGVLAAIACSADAAPAACRAHSSAAATPVIELYTSEGCNSCPPADRWLAGFKDRADVVALAFHVDYWDRLGWKDRFASPAYTRRQAEQLAVNGARFAYTPQVVIDGVDRKDWPRVSSVAAAPRAPVSIELVREGDAVAARVTPLAGAPQRLAAYWAVTEYGQRTAVRAGENQGATLLHESVVRDYVPIAAWRVAAGAAQPLHYTPPAADPLHPRRISLVIVDAASGRPLQALALAC